MFTVSNALLMSSATVIVHSAGWFWLKPIVMVLFMLCSSVFVLVDKGKYNEFCIVKGKLITLYFSINHVLVNLGYFPLIIVQNV